MNVAIAALLVSLLAIATYVAIRLYLGLRRLQTRYAPIIDLDSEVARVRDTLGNRKLQLQEFLSDNERQ